MLDLFVTKNLETVNDVAGRPVLSDCDYYVHRKNFARLDYHLQPRKSFSQHT